MVDPEVASALAGRGRMEVSGRSVTSIVTGTATSDSADGSVMVDMGGNTVSGDGSQSVPIATTASIKEGDTVQVALSGPDGTAKGTTVIGTVGGGDRMQEQVDAAIASVDVEYAIGASATDAPTDGWQTDAPSTTDESPYLWTRTKTVDGAGDETYTTPAVVTGRDGRGVASVAEQYYLSTSRIELTGGSWTEKPTAPSDGQYVWTRSVVTYDDGTSDTLDAISVQGAKGDTGPQGEQGEKGDTGADGQMLVATSTTAAGTAAKTATLKSGTLTLEAGASVTVVFSNANTAASPTLNVSSTGAKAIRTNGTPYAYWVAGTAASFVYDGTYWQTCSVPVYASTVTVGNSAGRNVYIDSDSVDIRSGGTVLADFQSDVINLGKNSTSSKVTFSGGVGNIWQSDSSMRLGSDKGVYLQVGSGDSGDDRGMGFLPDGDATKAYVSSESFVYNTGNLYAVEVLFSGDSESGGAFQKPLDDFDMADFLFAQGRNRLSVSVCKDTTFAGKCVVPSMLYTATDIFAQYIWQTFVISEDTKSIALAGGKHGGDINFHFASGFSAYVDGGTMNAADPTPRTVHLVHVVGWRK